MIIIEMSAKDIQISKDMFTWLTRLTQKSQYILIDRDIQDEYFYYENTDEIKCTYDPADKKLTLFPRTFSAKTYEEAVDCYINNFGVKSLKSLFSSEKYELDFSEVEIVRLPNKFYLSKYIMTPFTNLKEIEIGNEIGCTNVYEHACEGLKSLEIIPLENVELISDFAFANSGITQIKSEKLTEIGNNAFENCKDLTTVTTSKELMSIGANAFEDSGINSFTIPETVTVIPEKTFYNCSMLEDVEIALTDDGMKIGKGAFAGISDTCNIKWNFGEGDNIYYNLFPFNMPSYEVDINVLQDYNNKEYTITKGERVKKEYTITFDANGGECDVESMIVEEGGVYENLPIPTRVGFEFVGWIDVDGNVYKDGEKVGIERNLTFVAKWYNKNETENPYQQIENTAWTFGEKEIKTANYNNLRKISNETLSMKPIYRLNKRNIGVFYSYGNDEELNDLEFTKAYDEKNADFLFELINNYNDGDVLWIVTKDSYECCPKNLQGIVVNSELSKEDLKRALTLMHCKYFQYLTFVQYPYTNSEEQLNKRENTVKGYSFFVHDWETSVTHPIVADVYPVEVSLFHKYYNYCDEMNTGLEELLNNVFKFDTNTTVVDAILTINEYVINHTGFDENPLKGDYSSDYIHLVDGKYYLQVNNKNTKKDFVEIYIDSNKFVRDINVDEDSKEGYFETYIDAEGYHINRHRIYDLIWFLRDTSDDRNKKKDNEYHHGVCASYSKFLHTIMGKCGYEALIVGGSDAPNHEVHSFSKTPLDGKNYYCDITDTYNTSDNPTQWLFFTKCDYVDNHGEPRMDDPFNGKKIVFTDEDTDLNVTLDACGGKMEIYYNVDKKIIFLKVGIQVK